MSKTICFILVKLYLRFVPSLLIHRSDYSSQRMKLEHRSYDEELKHVFETIATCKLLHETLVQIIAELLVVFNYWKF